MTDSETALNFLIVDFLDSFSYNIPAFFSKAAKENGKGECVCHVKSYQELTKDDVDAVAIEYDGVILSAGPGTVECEHDLGDFTPALLDHRPVVPVFGICLGFQAICRAFGGKIRRLSIPHHGIVSEILDPLSGKSLHRRATRYHSLEVVLEDEQCQGCFEVQGVARNFNDQNSECVMEVRHRQLPFWGVQYHPESQYSKGCHAVVYPFLQAAHDLRRTRKQALRENMNGHCSPNPCHPRHPKAQINGDSSADATVVAWESFPLDIRISDLIAEHKIDTDQFVLLDSGTKDDWAILSSSSTAWSFRYSLRRGGSTFTPLDNALTEHDNKLQLRGDPWNWLRCISSSRNFTGGPSDTPFWGGFVGYFSYELGLNQISITPYTQTAGRTDKVPDYDDISLLYSTETIVYHIPTKTVYLISLNRDTWWIKRTRALLRSHAATANGSMKPQHAPIVGRTVHPDRGQYLKKIEKAQERIRAGDSYELCLTATTTVQDLAAQRFKSAGKESHNENSTSTRRTRKNAHRFNDLRSKNPAAFMSFLQLNGMTLLSASPEEFLNFDASTRTARMRPIKGTLSKLRPDGKTPVSFSEAETELHDPKTVAENLMILDLIRNDLSKVSIDVTCPKPLWVEEISTMYQLVSTIEARVEPKVTAWDLLKATLPPGSMTGAPKRRSCEILQELEGEGSFRGVYSGIVGYIDVRGHSRTSVNIRNIARYPGEDAWRVGAGGAITCLSDPVAEWEERQLKTRGVCRVFEGDFGVLETMRWDPEDQQVVHVEEHARRLSKSLRFFGFSNPLYNESSGNLVPPSKCNGSSHSRKRPAEQVPDEAVALWNLVRSRPSPSLKSQNLRISLAIDRSGTVTRFDAIPITITNLNTTTIPIDTTMQDPNNDINNKPAEIETVKVRLDPCSIHVAALEPFISHKTTHRDHYSAARERAGVQGREEVLMFSCCSDRIPDVNGERCDGGSGGGRGGTSDHTVQIGAPDDLLTEGSYTNVAIFDQDRSVWVTPARGCLQGIEREKLLQSGTIVQGDVRRKHLQNNPRVWLFNSVRGVFEGKLELLDG